MKGSLLHIYDLLHSHRRWLWTGVIAVLLPLIGLAVSLRYNENILDFLPATPEERAAFEQIQAQQSASRMVLIIEGEDEEAREEALYECADRLPELDLDVSEQMKQMYAQLPHFIDDSIYDRFDSLFTAEAIRSAMQRDRAILSTPGGSMLAHAIQADPLGLLQTTNHQGLTANKSFAFYSTPYGSTETKNNAALVDSLMQVTEEVGAMYPNLSLRWIGAPVISVGNARRIKTDTMVCIALSLVLIIGLLAYAFPRRRDLWLILLATSFGWLFGMAVLRLVTPSVSAVVLGIGSVLIGIAVNYPLHLLVHQRYTKSVRQTLDEVLSPLVVGNITTVGAFLALIPLQSTALRHLGIFAACMLVGTILFCLFVLPHLMSAEPTPVREIRIPLFESKMMNPSVRKTGQWIIVGLTVLAGIYLFVADQESKGSWFDSNLSHINYMTEEQRADMRSFEARRGDASRWTEYWQTHDAEAVIATIQTEAEVAGFRPEAFAPFYQLMTEWKPAPAFEISDLAKRLSDDFDYIGLVCSLIVFAFLWLSFRNLWLALIAFVPMMLSWVWILALMHLFGLQFNIVNIILATFIFGQGDDYTIFIVEGLVYEHKTGKAILPKYRQSILLSALIMLIGIGILVFAVHPAMHSLGTVTLIGMSIVLLMATTVPPLLFRLYTRLQLRKGGNNG